MIFRHTDADGGPGTNSYSWLLRHDFYDERYVQGAATVTMRLPKATYVLGSLITTGPEKQERFALIAYPLLTVDRDLTVDLDARQARPIRFSTPDPATPLGVNVGFDGKVAWTTYSSHLFDTMGRSPSTLHLGARPAQDTAAALAAGDSARSRSKRPRACWAAASS